MMSRLRVWLVLFVVLGVAHALEPRLNFPISVAISPKGDQAVFGNEENACDLRALPEMRLIRTLESEKGSYVRWHPREPRVAIFSSHLLLYETESWKLLHHTADSFLDVTFHPEKALLLGLQQLGESSFALVLLDLGPNPTPMTFPISDAKPSRIAWAGADRVAVFGSDGNVSLVDLARREIVATASFPELRAALAVDSVPALGLVACMSQETGKLLVFRAPSLEPVLRLAAQKPGYGECVRFSPDGRLLATGAGYPESSLRLWDVATGAERGIRRVTQALDVAFTPDGKSLVVCDHIQELPHLVALKEILDQP